MKEIPCPHMHRNHIIRDMVGGNYIGKCLKYRLLRHSSIIDQMIQLDWVHQKNQPLCISSYFIWEYSHKVAKVVMHAWELWVKIVPLLCLTLVHQIVILMDSCTKTVKLFAHKGSLIDVKWGYLNCWNLIHTSLASNQDSSLTTASASFISVK